MSVDQGHAKSVREMLASPDRFGSGFLKSGFMKTRIAVAVIAVISFVGLYTSNVFGVQPSKVESLPNYDKRLEVPRQQNAANAVHNNNAEAALKTVVRACVSAMTKFWARPAL